MPFVSRVLVCARAYHTTFLCGLCAGFVEGVWFVCRVCGGRCGLCTDFAAGGTPRRCVHFQFEYVSTTVLPLSFMESTNSLCTESAARDTPRHSVHFSFSASLKVRKLGVAKSIFVLILNARENVAKECYLYQRNQDKRKKPFGSQSARLNNFIT